MTKELTVNEYDGLSGEHDRDGLLGDDQGANMFDFIGNGSDFTGA